jgi:DNA adenine methylase
MRSYDITKPFIKWVGGKTQIIEPVLSQFPPTINNYHEIFLGGGSVLLAVLTLIKHGDIKLSGSVYASDLNKSLIFTYKNIQTRSSDVHRLLFDLVNTYDSIEGTLVNRSPSNEEESLTSQESYYYWIRKKFNECDPESLDKSAMFIFLNKTCFRGVYREGPRGFNVPFGHGKTTPRFMTLDEITAISDLIKDVVFTCCDFSTSIGNVNKGDYVYLDPPYAPVNSNSFVGYTVDGFDLDTHRKLFETIIEMEAKGADFLMSNAKVDIIDEYFSSYVVEDIIARRAINSKNPAAKCTEVLVSNQFFL